MNLKTVLVTGANSGIGFETAAGLAEMGANVVITSRDPARGEAAAEAIVQRYPGSRVTPMVLDLARLADVRAFAQAFDERFPQLQVLINNAGLILDKRTLTEDGFESTFQINHLGPFLLTNLLMPKLKASGPSRIVNVSSTAHRGLALDFDDLQSERGYRGMRVYGKSKLCNILFTRELARRLEGTKVSTNCLHPGTVRTGFGKNGDLRGLLGVGIQIAGPFFRSPKSGAKTSIYLASAYDVEPVSGEYFVGRRSRKPSSAAQNDEDARRLWDVSAAMVGL